MEAKVASCSIGSSISEKTMPVVGDGPKPNKEDEGMSERPAAKNTPVPIAIQTKM